MIFMEEEKKVKKTTKKSPAKKAPTTSKKVKKTTLDKTNKTSPTGVKRTTKTSESKKSSRGKSSTVKTEPKKQSKTTKQVKKVDSKKTLDSVINTQEVLKEEIKPSVKEESKISEKPEVMENVLEKSPVYETRRTIKKAIPLSNYLIAAIIIVWVVIIAYVGYELSRRHQENLYQEGYFIHEKIDIKKLSLTQSIKILQDQKETTFILFNYRGYEETYQLEKDLWKIMNDYHIAKNFYYVDLTDENGTLNCDMTCVLNTSFHITNFKNVPAVAYYANGTLIDVAQREDKKVLEAADFVKLLDSYEFKR